MFMSNPGQQGALLIAISQKPKLMKLSPSQIFLVTTSEGEQACGKQCTGP